MDFRNGDWPSALTGLDHSPDETTAFFLEGLLMYLAPDTVDALLAEIR